MHLGQVPLEFGIHQHLAAPVARYWHFGRRGALEVDSLGPLQGGSLGYGHFYTDGEVAAGGL